MNSETNSQQEVIAKVQAFYKIGNPIIFTIAGAFLITFCILESDPFVKGMFIFLLAMIVPSLILCLVNPINAIIYDKQNEQLIIRAGRTFFTTFKRRYVYIADIEKVYYIEWNGFNPASGLYIVVRGKTMPLRTVGAAGVAAEKINRLRAEQQMKREIEKDKA